ncbi:MAG: DNA cytosine methyltransferase [Polaromonas sp.]|nr:DNA cytosine methyltransferase [Polaromonas sp.]
MLSPQFTLDLNTEIVVDLFAGGGGASTGIEMALRRHVDVAVNHNPTAISLHTANHPQTEHYVSDVFEVDPIQASGGRPVSLLWASPDCRHFSKAKGSKPVSQKVRGLAWIVVRWAKMVRPRCIVTENVEEFQTWGPLTEGGYPCPERKGTTFKRWVAQLKNLGYQVEWRELRACDFGAPTIRKRLFVIARCDGEPIVWPQPTHGEGLRPYRTAAECIDWSLSCSSIFERPKSLAAATLRRVAHGFKRYTLESSKPYIVRIGQTGHGDGGKVMNIQRPLTTVTTKAEHLVLVPTLIQTGYGEREGQQPRVPGLDKPLGTAVAGGVKHAITAAVLIKNFGGEPAPGKTAQDLASPAPTILATGGPQSLLTASLVHLGHGEQSSTGAKRWSHGIRDIRVPLNTITASGCPAGVVTTHLLKEGAEEGQGLGLENDHSEDVRNLLVSFYPELAEQFPEGPITVDIEGISYKVIDLRMRMLQPHELFKAQGFPEHYQIDKGALGEKLTKEAQVRLCGNSVSPAVAEAIVRANLGAQSLRKAA